MKYSIGQKIWFIKKYGDKYAGIGDEISSIAITKDGVSYRLIGGKIFTEDDIVYTDQHEAQLALDDLIREPRSKEYELKKGVTYSHI